MREKALYGKKTIRANLKSKFRGAYITNFSFDFETGNSVVANGEADLVAFG